MLTNCLAACAHLTITISKIERDICEKLSFYHTPLHSTPPLGGFPLEYWHPLWYGKTRMESLPDNEKILKICLFVLTWSMNVSDGRMDTAWQQRPGLCIASCGKNQASGIYSKYTVLWWWFGFIGTAVDVYVWHQVIYHKFTSVARIEEIKFCV